MITRIDYEAFDGERHAVVFASFGDSWGVRLIDGHAVTVLRGFSLLQAEQRARLWVSR